MNTRERETPRDDELLRIYQDDPEGERGRQAASALLARYQDKVYLWCRRMMRDHERALEMAQEVLVRAFRGMSGFEGRSGFSSWLFAIARNRCLADLRRPGLLRDEEADPDEVPGDTAAPDRIREEELGEEALLRLIGDALEPVEQEVLWLRCVEKMPVEAITSLLDLRGSSGARGVLQRARRKLRAAMLRPPATPWRPGAGTGGSA